MTDETAGRQHTELVLRDLVDTLLRENLFGAAEHARRQAPAWVPDTGLGPGEYWCHVPLDGCALAFRARDGGELQRIRLSTGPVWHHVPGAPARELGPGELLSVLGPAGGEAGQQQVIDDVRTAAEHAAAVPESPACSPLRPTVSVPGERLAATRGRPFHPTARAVGGWSAGELARYGPMRASPLGLDWMAVRRDRLRCSGDAEHMPERVLGQGRLSELHDACLRAGVSREQHVLLPVHPWQREHVLPDSCAAELARADVVPVARDLGAFRPTASVRTLATEPETRWHVKLPLSVHTLGATRLLPPRHLDNGSRAQTTMAGLLATDSLLAGTVSLCDEHTWCVWRDPYDDDEFADRPGLLAAQLRRYPERGADTVVLPMAALAAHHWELLGAHIDSPVSFFRDLATRFCEFAFAFLRYGVLPELHGQNVVVLLNDGAVTGFVLRDHDTVRVYPKWMRAAGVPEPGYRIRPGARQSLLLDSGEDLLGYLQTLGFQVNLYGIIDALAPATGTPERVFWAVLRSAISRAACRVDPPEPVAGLLRQRLLDSSEWPSRQVLGPLLRSGRSTGVSMPAATGTVANPLHPGARLAARAARAGLLNSYLRETGRRPGTDGVLEIPLEQSGITLRGTVGHVSAIGQHTYGDRFHTEHGELGHDRLVHAIVGEVSDAARRQELVRQAAESTARAARYLEQEPRQWGGRHAEQDLLLGHPLHPVPKAAEGFRDSDLAAYSPELGAEFSVHWYAIADELHAERRVVAGLWEPPEVARDAPDGCAVLPVHPWQARYLERMDVVRRWIADGLLVPLGPAGEAVHPSSSVRTVCAPGFPTAWKLPLHVRITNFVRTNPAEHVRRALDASTVIDRIRHRWSFDVLLETGSRGVRDTAIGADFAVLYRENPFGLTDGGPWVVAALLEDRLDGTEPPILTQLRTATGCRETRIPEGAVAEWVGEYLRVCFLPLLEAFEIDGVSLEAHPQNCLLGLRDGWPDRMYVRDMEGACLVRENQGSADLPQASPALYSRSEAWRRLRYNLVTNHIGQLMAVLARHGGRGEMRLWRLVRDLIDTSAPGECAASLLTSESLPAKANLRSWATARQETPLYVPIPNPIREVDG